MRRFVSFMVAAAALTIGASATAQEVNKQGTLVISADRLVGYNSVVTSSESEQGGVKTERSNSDNRLSLLGSGGGENRAFNTPRLSLDFMVAEGVSIGGSLGIFTSGGESETTTGSNTNTQDAPSGFGFMLAPRAGYLYMFDEMIGIWPRLGVTFYNFSSTQEDPQGTGETETSTSGFNVDLEVPFMFAINDHFFINAGPVIDIPLTGNTTVKVKPNQGQAPPDQEIDSKIFNIGLMVGIGGNL